MPLGCEQPSACRLNPRYGTILDAAWEAHLNNVKMFLFAIILTVFCFTGSALRAQSGTTARRGHRITCASDDGHRHFCRIRTHGDVRLVNQRSGSPCIEGRTWGYTRQGIWVDRGCRADFAVRRRH